MSPNQIGESRDCGRVDANEITKKRRRQRVIRIAITQAAFDAIAATPFRFTCFRKCPFRPELSRKRRQK
jgi:hypothetical protein